MFKYLQMKIVAQMVQFLFERVENIFGKLKNAGYQYIVILPQCFQKAFVMFLF